MTDCSRVRDILPLSLHGRLGADAEAGVRHHLDRCGECAEELHFLERLMATRPLPPEDLTSQVLDQLQAGAGNLHGAREEVEMAAAGVHAARPSAHRRAMGWSLSVAAMVILSLGIGLNWSGSPVGNGDVILASFLMTADDEDPDEWMVAGAPVLDALPDDFLLELMSELE